jgi:spore coat protein U-like protein
MKNFTFILLALLSGTAFAQNSANATSTADAKIVQPISISAGTETLDFGQIVAISSAETVTISTDGTTRTATGTNMLVAGSSFSQASFDLNAENGLNYSVSIPDISLTGSGPAMNVSFTNDASGTGTGTTESFNVGGTLSVGTSLTQTVGAYSGTVAVTVTYE